MIKIVVACAVLVAVCYAQEPRLMIKETFQSTFKSVMEFHGGPRREGTGKWDRSEIKKASLRSDTVTNSTGTVTFKRLTLYGEGMEYMEENTRCEGHKLPEQDEFPMIWRDFEEKGHYAGERPEKVGNSTVEVYVWVLMIPGREREVLELWAKATTTEVTVPFAMERKGSHGVEAMIFEEFMPEEPQSNTFVIPEACKMATTSHFHPKPKHH